MNKTELLDQLKIELKRHGFRKNRTTWRKDFGEVIAVLNVQTSQWDNDDYFINLGVYLKCLGDNESPTEFKCHVRTRLEHEMKHIDITVTEALKWFKERSTISLIRDRAKEDSSHGLVMKAVREL